jgi:hypothetical protein
VGSNPAGNTFYLFLKTIINLKNVTCILSMRVLNQLIVIRSTFITSNLSNIDCFTAGTACLVCFISTVNDRSKKRSLGRLAIVAGT